LLDSLTAIEAKRIPNSSPYVYALYLIPYSAGQYDRAEQVLDSANAASRSNDVRVMGTFLSSELLAVHGRLNSAERRYRESATLAGQSGNATLPLTDSINLAAYDAWLRNQPQRAAARLDAALAVHPLAALPERDRPYTLLAYTYALAGRPDRARAVLGQLAQIKDTALLRSLQPNTHAALGEIAIAEKRYGDAIREIQRSDTAADGRPANEDPAFVHFDLGRAYDLANKPDSAIAEFEAFLRAGYDSRLDDDMFGLAGTHKRLGELYDAKGDREKAISHLSKFVELWKNADPELQPAVADAKRRLAKLQAGGKG
jgi:tetratricopeptide (TPR) repeat protein